MGYIGFANPFGPLTTAIGLKHSAATPSSDAGRRITSATERYRANVTFFALQCFRSHQWEYPAPLGVLVLMEYKGIQYQVIQTAKVNIVARREIVPQVLTRFTQRLLVEGVVDTLRLFRGLTHSVGPQPPEKGSGGTRHRRSADA
jgi:hypothetical protein